jgi:hypothetical protein
MSDELMDLVQKVHNETTFIQFLRAMIQDLEKTERECSPYPSHICVAEGHWESRTAKDYLESVEDWASRGDFADGVHFGEPILRRVATMLYVGRYRKHPSRRDDDDR